MEGIDSISMDASMVPPVVVKNTIDPFEGEAYKNKIESYINELSKKSLWIRENS